MYVVRLTLCFWAGVLLSSPSFTQTPTVAIQERAIADLGPAGYDVNESALAVTR